MLTAYPRRDSFHTGLHDRRRPRRRPPARQRSRRPLRGVHGVERGAGPEPLSAPGRGGDRAVQRQQRDPRHADRLRASRWSRSPRTSRRSPTAADHVLHGADQGARVARSSSPLCAIFGAENVGMLTGDASVNSRAPIICCTAEVLANIALREGADADVGQVVMDEFHFYAEPQRGWAWQVPLLSLPQAQFLLMSATLGDVSDAARGPDAPDRPRDRADRRRRAPRPAALHAGRSSRCTSCSRSSSRADQAPIYVVHFTQASALERAQSLLVGEALHARGARRDRRRDRRASASPPASAGRCPSSCAAASASTTPACCRATGGSSSSSPRPGLLKVICGHRHARRRHQRPDPHRRLHRPGEVRRHPPPAAEGARVPPDRRPRRAAPGSTRPATSSCRRPSTRSRTRAAGQGRRRPQEAPQGPEGQEAARRRGQLDRGDVRAPARRDARGARLAHARQPRDDPQRHQPAARTRSRRMRALMEDNHEDERGRARLSEQAAVARARSCSTSGVLERLAEPDADGRTLQLAPALQEDFALNQPLASFALAAFELIDPESETYALDVALGRRGDPRRPVPGADGAGQQGARRGRRRR